jgi:hypothetical protein
MDRDAIDGPSMNVTASKGFRAAFIKPEMKLKHKALTLNQGLGLSLTDEELSRIESTIDEHKDEFVTQILTRLQRLRSLLSEGDDDLTLEPEALVEQLRIDAYEIKGLGTTFGFPPLTMIAKLLHDYVDTRTELPPKQREIAAVHVDALYVVLAQQLTALPIVTEHALITGLATLATRFP